MSGDHVNSCFVSEQEFVVSAKGFVVVPDQIGTLSQVGTSSYMAYAM